VRRLPVTLGWMSKRPLPAASLVEIPDSYTLIMRDQPTRFAGVIREFVRETSLTTGS
jgi:hypothetical protein